MKSLHNKLPGKFSTNDGSIDFYLRIRNLIDKKKVVLDLGAGRGDWYLDNNNRIAKQIQFLKNDVIKHFVYSLCIHCIVFIVFIAASEEICIPIGHLKTSKNI